MPGDLSVAEAAEALGVSPQTVRTLLRKGELRGHKREWGSRYVWEVSQDSIDEFVATFGRLEGQRRITRPAPPPQPAEEAEPPPGPHEPEPEQPDVVAPEAPPAKRRPWFLRPRGRASVVVVLLGIPLLIAFVIARVLPGALWFDELDQLDVFRRIISAKADFHSQVLVGVAVCVGANLAVALRGTRFLGSLAGVAAIGVISLVTGNLFASATDGQWTSYLLWRHHQSFGTVDPLYGKDVGFYVFSLPFHLEVCTLLLWLVAVTTVYVVPASRARGALRLKPFRIDFAAQVHLAVLAAVLLLVLSWRLRLERYLLVLDQPNGSEGHTFAGAGYVDVNVRSPALAGLSVLALLLACGCLLLPFALRGRRTKAVRLALGVSGTVLVTVVALVVTLAPPLVQRYVVDPNPLLSEQTLLANSMAATRAGLGLDAIDPQPYQPASAFTAADFPAARKRLANVPAWDTYILEARMRQLVTEPPYFSPQEPVIDVVPRGVVSTSSTTEEGTTTEGGGDLVTNVSARELDLNQVPGEGGSWINDRVAYTHGLGLVRFSSTAIGRNREPRLLDSGLGERGLGLSEPRIYFGDLPPDESEAAAGDEQLRVLTPTLDANIAQSRWVLANTRRPEVDLPATPGKPRAPYHYQGTGGIQLSDWVRRAVFALALGSREILLSDDITPDSRLLLHRDVHDRLRTLAPFIQWDSEAVPLTANGRVVYVVDGYTTSDRYPYGQQVALGGAQVSYARASVLATVDAFTGDVRLHVTEDEPIIRAWQEIFPSLFRPLSELPAELRGRLRYPADLFAAQATAYERFHTTSPDQFVSGADDWARPLALSGPIEVAGDVDFDEDDEDDLRLTLPPVYIYAPPPGEADPRIVLATYYTPTRGQNLVGTLSGWIDDDGRARLGGLSLPRDPITLGPAQMSRLVFATPRVRNLLGLRNLEIRDLDKSSIDSVLLGRPRLLFFNGGLVQVQNLYEGSRGPGAARLLGITAFVNGRAGLGPDVESAVRQALNEPPRVRVLQPRSPPVVGKPVRLAFQVRNAHREVVTITTATGKTRTTLEVANGRGTLRWVPSTPGPVRLRVAVAGLDGTQVSHSVGFRVLGPAPRVRFVDPAKQGVVGRPVRVDFAVRNAVDATATISTRAGIVLTRRYELADGPGVVVWTPDASGPAVLTIRVRGTQDQVTTKRLVIQVEPVDSVTPPTVALVRVPPTFTEGEPASFAFQADGCQSALARIRGPGEEVRVWRFPCPAAPGRFSWTPTAAGPIVLTILARGQETSSQTSIPLIVEEP
ncbi:UPF0182 family protein [Nocardioides sp.]|uniref:UPF0182 family protein n=1 Tax=Nocardioides sp. TaxID=35761 RepID=UPI003D0A3035